MKKNPAARIIAAPARKYHREKVSVFASERAGLENRSRSKEREFQDSPIPTTTNTPTTAPVLLKNALLPPELALLRVGFRTIWVMVWTTPDASEERMVEVMEAGTEEEAADEAVSEAVTKTVEVA